MTKKAAAGSQQEAKIPVPPQLAKFVWPKGVTGNPTGKNGFTHHKVLTEMLIDYFQQLDPDDVKKLEEWRKKKKHKKGELEPVPLQRGQKFMIELVARAMKNSDFLMAEIYNRIEGKQRPETLEETKEQKRPTMVVIDIGRPPRVAPSILPEVHVPDRLISPPQPEQRPEEKKRRLGAATS
jgi:hypothetical protein